MAFSIDLPTSLGEDLAVGAERAGVSISDRAACLLQVVTAMTAGGRETPFRGVVQAHLRRNAIDADRLADLVENLMTVYFRERRPASTSGLGMDPDGLAEIIDREPPGPDEGARPGRVSALGRLAHLDLTSERFIAEKRLETAREDEA